MLTWPAPWKARRDWIRVLPEDVQSWEGLLAGRLDLAYRLQASLVICYPGVRAGCLSFVGYAAYGLVADDPSAP